jgi:signal transduction histidine kinase
MSHQLQTPFESIENAQEYLRLLSEEVALVLREIEDDRTEAASSAQSRRLDALHLVCYKLQRLSHHVDSSRRILNDLRLLRRLFERDSAKPLPERPSVAA